MQANAADVPSLRHALQGLQIQAMVAFHLFYVLGHVPEGTSIQVMVMGLMAMSLMAELILESVLDQALTA